MSEKTQTKIEALNKTLVEKAKAGDSAALSKLCEANEKFIYSIMLMKTRNEEVAKDLTQDTLIKMISNISQYVKSENKFRGWLSTIITSVFIDHIRKESHRLEKFSASLSTEFSDSAMNDEHKEGELEYNVLSHDSVERDYIRVEQNEMMKKIILRSIESLSNTDQKRAIVLSIFQDLTYNEISEKLEVSLSNTKVLLNRAKLGILKHIVENNFHLAGKMLDQMILKDKVLENMSEEDIAEEYNISLKRVQGILDKSMKKVFTETFFNADVVIL